MTFHDAQRGILWQGNLKIRGLSLNYEVKVIICLRKKPDMASNMFNLTLAEREWIYVSLIDCVLK